MTPLLSASAVLWALALAVGAIDGLYFHLWKYRLYARPESRAEHRAHLGRAFLLPPTLWFAFLAPGSATAQRLVPLVILIALDAGLGVWDVLLETASRRAIGGLLRSEYLIHVVATALHSGAEVLAVAAWALAGTGGAAFAIGSPVFAKALASLLLPIAIASALLHAMLLHPRFRAVRDKGSFSSRKPL